MGNFLKNNAKIGAKAGNLKKTLKRGQKYYQYLQMLSFGFLLVCIKKKAKMGFKVIFFGGTVSK